MTDEQPPLRIRKRRLKHYRKRGLIYSWLRAHFDEVSSHLASEEGTWPRLCAEMERHDVVDRVGQTPTPNQALQVWRRVKKDVAQDPPPPPNRFKNYPSRISKDWRPSGFQSEDPSLYAPPAPESGESLPAQYREPAPAGSRMAIPEKLQTESDFIRTPVSDDRKRYVKERIAAARRDIQGR